MRCVFVSVFCAIGAMAMNIPGYSRTVSYTGEKVLKCKLNNDETLLDSLVDRYQVDIWGTSELGTIDIRVKDDLEMKGVMTAFNSECEVTVSDVEALVQGWETEWESAIANQSSTDRNLLQDNWFTNYRSYSELVNWYRNFATANPSLVTWIPSIGRSFEGRDMPAIIMTSAPANAPNVYMQCLIHAREWISGATCNWIANQLIADFNRGDAVAREILTTSRIHLVPFTNPDGYEFSRTNSRLWRKSRNTNQGSTCMGTDLNRNYNDNWGRGGSSTNPCTDTFMGASPASAPETQATSNYFRSIAPVVAGMDWHAYSQLILRPYGWTNTLAPDEARFQRVGADMQRAIQQNGGRNYQNIRSIQLYVTTGTTSDWFYGVDATNTNRGFRAAGYTMELRPAGANPGFQLPPSEIVPSGVENYAAFRVWALDFIRNPIRV
jgi:murein tripeptide amidase MpaA